MQLKSVTYYYSHITTHKHNCFLHGEWHRALYGIGNISDIVNMLSIGVIKVLRAYLPLKQ